jgi:hypothetical protein
MNLASYALISVVGLIANTPVNAQTSRTATASSPCSVAIVGSHNTPTINCGSISKEDAQKLADVLNSIQRSNVNLDSLITRMDELIAEVKNKVDPNKPTVTFDFQGNMRSDSPGRASIDRILVAQSFMPMAKLADDEQWSQLAALAEQEKLKTPEWSTPQFFAGLAYLHLCDRNKSLENLRGFRDRTKDYPAYAEGYKYLAELIPQAESLPRGCNRQ